MSIHVSGHADAMQVDKPLARSWVMARVSKIGVGVSSWPKCHCRSIRTDFFEKQKQLTQPPPPSVLAQRAQQQAMLLQKASSSTGGVVLAGAHRPQALLQPSFCSADFCIISTLVFTELLVIPERKSASQNSNSIKTKTNALTAIIAVYAVTTTFRHDECLAWQAHRA